MISSTVVFRIVSRKTPDFASLNFRIEISLYNNNKNLVYLYKNYKIRNKLLSFLSLKLNTHKYI